VLLVRVCNDDATNIDCIQYTTTTTTMMMMWMMMMMMMMTMVICAE